MGCLLGGAIGDALGYPVEFVDSAAKIIGKHGAAPPASLAYAGPARISDDTQMTLFTGEGLIRVYLRGSEKGIWHPPSFLALAYRRWHATQVSHGLETARVHHPGWLLGEQRLYARRAPGNTCLAALSREWDGSPPTVDKPPNDSKGCGAVMRSAPIGLAHGTREKAFQLGRDGAVITHGHASGYLSAAYFASVIHDLARSVELPAAMAAADALLARERGGEELAAVIDKVRALAPQGPPSPAAIESIGGGWVGEEALGIALLCALTVPDGSPAAFRDALWRSVVHAGDSDSTGSMTGNLLGAMFGEACLPPAWCAEVELGEVVVRIARDLHAVWIDGADLDARDYPRT